MVNVYQTYFDYHENRIYPDWLQIRNEYFIKPTWALNW